MAASPPPHVIVHVPQPPSLSAMPEPPPALATPQMAMPRLIIPPPVQAQPARMSRPRARSLTPYPQHVKLWPSNKWSRIALLVAVVYFLLVAAFEIVILSLHATQASFLGHPGMEAGRAFSQIVILYHAVCIFGLVFTLYLAVDMVLKKNMFEVVAYIILLACTFAYSIVQYKQHARLSQLESSHLMNVHHFHHNSTGYEITNSVLIALAVVVNIFLAFKLYRVFGWDIYKRVGASPENQRMHMWLQIFMALVKLDVFYCLAYSIQILALVLRWQQTTWWVVIGIGIGATIVSAAIGIYAVWHESFVLMFVFLLAVVAGLAEAVERLVNIGSSDSAWKYADFKSLILFFTIMCFILLVATLLVGLVCLLNFGKGLRERISASRFRSRHAASSLNEDKNLNRQSWAIEE